MSIEPGGSAFEGKAATEVGPSGGASQAGLADREVALGGHLGPHLDVSPQPANGFDAIMVLVSQGLYAAARWWKFALPVGLVLASAGTAYLWMSFVPLYESTATLLLRSHAPYIAFRGADASTSGTTQIQLMKSRKVLSIALESLAQVDEALTQPDPIRWLQNGLIFRQVARSELYEVKFRHERPDHAKAVVDAVADAYLKVSIESDDEETSNVIQLLIREEQNLERVIAGKQEELRERVKELTGRDSIDEKSSSQSDGREYYSSLMEQLTTIDVEEKVTQAELMALNDFLAKHPDKEDVSLDPELIGQIEAHPDVTAHTLEIARRRSQLDDLDSKLKNASEKPTYQRLKRDLDNLESSLQERRRQILGELVEQTKAQQLSRQQQRLSELESKLAFSSTARSVIEKRLADESQRLSQVSGRSLDLEFMRDELARQEAIHRTISSRRLSLQTELGAPEHRKLFEEGDLPKKPVENVPTKKLLAVCLLGMIAPFGLAIGWEQTRRRIGDRSQLLKYNVRVVGEIAALPGKTVHPGEQTRGQSLFDESVHNLRTRLRLAKGYRDVHVLAICSGVSSEGKTSLASQLGYSIATSLGEPTLIIDADMRSPDIHRIFGIPNEPGLAQLLTDDCTLDDAVNRTASDVLHLLPAGRLADSPHRLLGNDKFRDLIAQLRERYRFIVIDAPPVLSSSESLVVASVADASIVCARRNFSRSAQVHETCERLAEADAKPLGVVLTGVPPGKYAAAYGRYPYVSADA